MLTPVCDLFPFSYVLSCLFQIFITNLSQVNPSLLNKQAVKQTTQVQHTDVFTIIDRSFRFEFPPGSPFRQSPVKASPGKRPASPSNGPSPKKNLAKVLSPKVSERQLTLSSRIHNSLNLSFLFRDVATKTNKIKKIILIHSP